MPSVAGEQGQDYNEIVNVVISEPDFHSFRNAINQEIGEVLGHVDGKEVERLVDEILGAEKVFFIAVGRVFLSLQCFAKRLAHLGIESHVVGSVNEKAITDKDLLVAASGSGESIMPVEIAKKARKFNARIGLITSARESTLKNIADFAVHLPSPTKNDPDYGVKSVQPMSTLFDQALHIFGDVVAMIIQNKQGLAKEELWMYHANLE
ncbi:MAG: SIS domain-containing protein [Candidatus Aenigmarchaeota archaeon]|nr:SIS domain-containing protein [Candidatus Aenigmarchaeota archaeon]